MHLMFCDETNASKSRLGDFFIYGGLIIDSGRVGGLAGEIERIRKDGGFEPGDPLKFNTKSRPRQLSVEEWTRAKESLLVACSEYGAKLVASFVHHGIAKRFAERQSWQLNLLLQSFDLKVLAALDDVGVVIIDRLGKNKEYDLLEEKFRHGGETPWAKRATFPRIVAYAASCDGASHLASACDVVLGSLGFCANHRSEENAAVPSLLGLLGPLLLQEPRGAAKPSIDCAFIFSPSNVMVPRYEEAYEDLKHHLRAMVA